jgi:sulfite reductase alpha subunit-like flavoprotein
VYGHNTDKDVSEFLAFYGVREDDLIGVARPNATLTKESRTAFQWLQQVCLRRSARFRSVLHGWIHLRMVQIKSASVTRGIDATLQYSDLFGRPSKGFYESLAGYATDEAQKAKLLMIARYASHAVSYIKAIAVTKTAPKASGHVY